MKSIFFSAALAMMASAMQIQQKGVPVLVNPVIVKPTGAEGEDLGIKLRVGPDDVKANKKQPKNVESTQRLIQTSEQMKTEQAKLIYADVQSYCKCMKEHMSLSQKDVLTTGDKECKPVKGVPGVDCTMDGYNITIEALKAIVTDKPTPITRPLEQNSTGNGFIATKLVQLSDDGSEDDAEEKAKAAAALNPKAAAAEAFGALAKESLKEDGIKEPPKKDGPMENPMKGEHLEITMRVGGSKIELTKEAHDRREKAKKDAEEAAVKAEAARQEAA